MLVIEHDMEFVRQIARTVTVLHEGSVLCEGPVDQVQQDERVLEVYLGRSGARRRARMLERRGARRRLRREPGALGRRPSSVPAGERGLPHGPQRRGQDHAAQDHHGAPARPRRGRIVFDGTDITRPAARASGPRAGIGYVPQGREIFPHLTVAGEPAHGRAGRGGRGTAAGDALDEVFALFPMLKQLLGRKGGVLSGGEQQQLAIGRVLLAPAQAPPAWTSRPRASSPRSSSRSRTPSSASSERGIAVLLVEQYLEFAWRLAGSYAIMRKGAIVAAGRPPTATDVVRQHLTV